MQPSSSVSKAQVDQGSPPQERTGNLCHQTAKQRDFHTSQAANGVFEAPNTPKSSRHWVFISQLSSPLPLQLWTRESATWKVGCDILVMPSVHVPMVSLWRDPSGHSLHLGALKLSPAPLTLQYLEDLLSLVVFFYGFACSSSFCHLQVTERTVLDSAQAFLMSPLNRNSDVDTDISLSLSVSLTSMPLFPISFHVLASFLLGRASVSTQDPNFEVLFDWSLPCSLHSQRLSVSNEFTQATPSFFPFSLLQCNFRLRLCLFSGPLL